MGMLIVLGLSLGAGWSAGGQDDENRKAVALTTAIRTIGHGLEITAGAFPGRSAVTAVLVYGLVQQLKSLLLALRWHRASSRARSGTRTPPPKVRRKATANLTVERWTMYQNIALLFAFAFIYSLVAGRLERTPVAGALVFTAFGLAVGPAGLDWLTLDVHAHGLRILAELTLALVLFTDAASADLRVLRVSYAIPERLLLIGLPLTILLGTGAAALLFPALGIVQCALLATMLAPTDAALGKAVVSNPAVPHRSARA